MPSSRDRPSGPSPDRSTGHVTVAIIDDHPAIRTALREALTDTMDLEAVGEAGSVEEALPLIEDTRPDVAVIDLSLRDGHGFDLLKQVREQVPDTHLLVFSMYDETVYAERALRAGASGYLMKEVSLQTVLTAIRRVVTNGIYLSPEMTSRVLQEMVDESNGTARFPIDELTDRELQVFQMLGQGLTVKAIADQLNLARKTVETYRRRAKDKLGYETAAEVVSHAARWVLGQPERDDPSSNGSPSD